MREADNTVPPSLIKPNTPNGTREREANNTFSLINWNSLRRMMMMMIVTYLLFILCPRQLVWKILCLSGRGTRSEPDHLELAGGDQDRHDQGQGRAKLPGGVHAGRLQQDHDMR